MHQASGRDRVFNRNARKARLRAIFRGVETAISIIFAISPLTLAAFSAISGA